MGKISPIKERILIFINDQKIKKTEFCKNTGISYANLKGKGLFSEIGGCYLGKILSLYPQINAEWLITGNGPVMKPNSSQNDAEFFPNDDQSALLWHRIEQLIIENNKLRCEIEQLKRILVAKS